MKIWPVKNIVLFGGSIYLVDFARLIKNTGKFDVVVYSAKRQIDEIIDGNKTLGKLLKEIGIPLFESIDINSSPTLRKHVDNFTLGVAFGAAWLFEKRTVNLFYKNHLLDFMGIDLPRYRGGAHYSWQILHQNKIGALNLQIIEGGMETFHMGKIIKSTIFKLPQYLKKPSDFFQFNANKSKIFLNNFLKDLLNQHNFQLTILDETKGSFYPYLSTETHGWIDWSWNGIDIYLFISAFDVPYKGASTLLHGQRVFLKKCELIKSDEKYHPFSSGLVIKKSRGSIYIASVGNLLQVELVTNIKGENIFEEVKPGDRFYTSHKELEKARAFSAIYNSKGLKKE